MKAAARAACIGVLGLATAGARADELPQIDHQPVPCTLPGTAFRVCAKVSDDVQVGKARIYFRRAGDPYYSFVDMGFDGLSYCATLPAPRQGLRQVEYYVQAIDSAYQAVRSSTYQLQVRPAEQCEFAPLDTDAARSAAIVVFATHQKQGRKPPEGFSETGVRFVPVAGGK